MVNEILSWLVISLLTAVFVLAFALKDTMNSIISETMKQQASPELMSSAEALAYSLYNYTQNGGSYSITFLEFGSTGCPACKRMEAVMDDIHRKYPDQVNLVFLNILKPENQLLMKYYGIAVIPRQVLLDKEARELFRQSGYLSTEDMEKQFTSRVESEAL